ncbi:Sodium channel protein 60E [Diplonema papillatum]|nr:Sodium channel protein 60E [Diplonema papillatum]
MTRQPDSPASRPPWSEPEATASPTLFIPHPLVPPSSRDPFELDSPPQHPGEPFHARIDIIAATTPPTSRTSQTQLVQDTGEDGAPAPPAEREADPAALHNDESSGAVVATSGKTRAEKKKRKKDIVSFGRRGLPQDIKGEDELRYSEGGLSRGFGDARSGWHTVDEAKQIVKNDPALLGFCYRVDRSVKQRIEGAVQIFFKRHGAVPNTDPEWCRYTREDFFGEWSCTDLFRGNGGYEHHAHHVFIFEGGLMAVHCSETRPIVWRSQSVPPVGQTVPGLMQRSPLTEDEGGVPGWLGCLVSAINADTLEISIGALTCTFRREYKPALSRYSIREMKRTMAYRVLGTTREMEHPYNVVDPPLHIIHPRSSFRIFLLRVIDHELFDATILVLILLNAATLVLADPLFDSIEWLDPFESRAEVTFQVLFTAEMVLKILALGFVLHPGAYLRAEPAPFWNRLDFLIVCSGFVSYMTPGSGNFTALRLLRCLRPLRTMNRVKKLRQLMSTLSSALPLAVDIFLLFFLLLWVFSTLGVQLFGGVFHRRCYVTAPWDAGLAEMPTGNGSTALFLGLENDTETTFDVSAGFENRSWLVANDTAACGARTCESNGLTVGQTCAIDQAVYRADIMNYDNIFSAMFLTFKIMSLDDWPVELVQTQNVFGHHTWIYFFLCTLFGNVFAVNLILAMLASVYADEQNQSAKVSRPIMERLSPATLLSAVVTHPMLIVTIPFLLEEEMRTIEDEHSTSDIASTAVNDDPTNGILGDVPDWAVTSGDRHPFDTRSFTGVAPLGGSTVATRRSSSTRRQPTEGPAPEVRQRRLSRSQLNSLISARTATHDAPMSQHATPSASFHPSDTVSLHHQRVGSSRGIGGLHPHAFEQSSELFLKTKSVSDAASCSQNNRDPIMQLESTYDDSVTTASTSLTTPEAPGLAAPPATGPGSTLQANGSDPAAAGACDLSVPIPAAGEPLQPLASGSAASAKPQENQAPCPHQGTSASSDEHADGGGDGGDYKEGEGPTEAPGSPARRRKHLERDRLWRLRRVGYYSRGTCGHFLFKVARNPVFNLFMSAVTVMNIVMLSLDHYGIRDNLLAAINVVNFACIYVFLAEALIKIVGMTPELYMSDKYNVFDFILVVASFPEMVTHVSDPSASTTSLTALRGFRLARLFRLAKRWKKLNLLLEQISEAIVNVGYLGVIVILFLFVYSVVGVQLFECDEPGERCGFENLGAAFLTVFAVLTGESWGEITKQTMQRSGDAALAYFCTLFLFGNYILLNLFIAILIDSFSYGDDEESSGWGCFSWCRGAPPSVEPVPEPDISHLEDAVAGRGAEESAAAEGASGGGDETPRDGRPAGSPSSPTAGLLGAGSALFGPRMSSLFIDEGSPRARLGRRRDLSRHSPTPPEQAEDSPVIRPALSASSSSEDNFFDDSSGRRKRARRRLRASHGDLQSSVCLRDSSASPRASGGQSAVLSDPATGAKYVRKRPLSRASSFVSAAGPSEPAFEGLRHQQLQHQYQQQQQQLRAPFVFPDLGAAGAPREAAVAAAVPAATGSLQQQQQQQQQPPTRRFSAAPGSVVNAPYGERRSSGFDRDCDDSGPLLRGGRRAGRLSVGGRRESEDRRGSLLGEAVETVCGDDEQQDPEDLELAGGDGGSQAYGCMALADTMNPVDGGMTARAAHPTDSTTAPGSTRQTSHADGRRQGGPFPLHSLPSALADLQQQQQSQQQKVQPAQNQQHPLLQQQQQQEEEGLRQPSDEQQQQQHEQQQQPPQQRQEPPSQQQQQEQQQQQQQQQQRQQEEARAQDQHDTTGGTLEYSRRVAPPQAASGESAPFEPDAVKDDPLADSLLLQPAAAGDAVLCRSMEADGSTAASPLYVPAGLPRLSVDSASGLSDGDDRASGAHGPGSQLLASFGEPARTDASSRRGSTALSLRVSKSDGSLCRPVRENLVERRSSAIEAVTGRLTSPRASGARSPSRSLNKFAVPDTPEQFCLNATSKTLPTTQRGPHGQGLLTARAAHPSLSVSFGNLPAADSCGTAAEFWRSTAHITGDAATNSLAVSFRKQEKERRVSSWQANDTGKEGTSNHVQKKPKAIEGKSTLGEERGQKTIVGLPTRELASHRFAVFQKPSAFFVWLHKIVGATRSAAVASAAAQPTGTCSPPAPVWRAALAVTRFRFFDLAVLIVIVTNLVFIALDHPALEDDNPSLFETLRVGDYIFVTLFSVEMLVKMAAWGVSGFMRDQWNVVDFVVVVTSILGLFVPTLRGFRSLRILRLVTSGSEEMKVVLAAITRAMPSIQYVIFVCLVVWYIFAIVGVSLFKGALYACTDAGVDREEDCAGPYMRGTPQAFGFAFEPANATWEREWFSYDDVSEAMFSLFQIAVGEKWREMMHRTMDAPGPGRGPRLNGNYLPASLFYVSFTVLGQFFFVNLFIGVLIQSFAITKSRTGRGALLTESQHKWVQSQRVLLKLKLRDGLHPQPVYVQNSWILSWVHYVATHPYFDTTMTSIIILNSITLALQHYNQPSGVTDFLFISNWFFVIVFTVEALIKLVAFSYHYFEDGWNRFDISIIAVSWIATMLSNASTSGLRILRVGRMLRLLGRAEGLKTIVSTMMSALPSLLNIGILLLVVFFIFGVFGVDLFGRVGPNDNLGEWENFDNLYRALVTLYQVSTTEGWNDIMEGVTFGPHGAQVAVARAYFTLFLVLGSFVFLNLFVYVLIDHFEEEKRANALRKSMRDLDAFEHLKREWLKEDIAGTGVASAESCIRVLAKLPQPLWFTTPFSISGFGRSSDFLWTQKQLRSMLIPLNVNMEVRYTDVVRTLSLKTFGIDIKQAIDQWRQGVRHSRFDPACWNIHHHHAVQFVIHKWHMHRMEEQYVKHEQDRCKVRLAVKMLEKRRVAACEEKIRLGAAKKAWVTAYIQAAVLPPPSNGNGETGGSPTSAGSDGESVASHNRTFDTTLSRGSADYPASARRPSGLGPRHQSTLSMLSGTLKRLSKKKLDAQADIFTYNRPGHVRMIWSDGAYTGQTAANKPEGVGRLTYLDGTGYFEGVWRQGQRHGKGLEVRGDTVCKGVWADNAVEGFAVYAHSGEGWAFAGTFERGRPRGGGKIEFFEGCCVSGTFRHSFIPLGTATIVTEDSPTPVTKTLERWVTSAAAPHGKDTPSFMLLSGRRDAAGRPTGLIEARTCNGNLYKLTTTDGALTGPGEARVCTRSPTETWAGVFHDGRLVKGIRRVHGSGVVEKGVFDAEGRIVKGAIELAEARVRFVGSYDWNGEDVTVKGCDNAAIVYEDVGLEREVQRWTGEFDGWILNGEGTKESVTGEKMVGKFRDGELAGFSLIRYRNGITCQGHFMNTTAHGWAKVQFPYPDFAELEEGEIPVLAASIKNDETTWMGTTAHRRGSDASSTDSHLPPIFRDADERIELRYSDAFRRPPSYRAFADWRSSRKVTVQQKQMGRRFPRPPSNPLIGLFHMGLLWTGTTINGNVPHGKGRAYLQSGMYFEGIVYAGRIQSGYIITPEGEVLTGEYQFAHKDAMGLDFDECRELAAGMQLMCVEILLGRQRADGILEQDCRRKELKVSTYPWGWEPQRPTASQTINVDGARPDRNAWKDTHEMLLALAEWCSTKRWSETGKEASISYFELAVDFELHSGLTLTPAGTQRRQENIAQRQPKERWTVADTLPGEETAAFFDGGSRGNGTNGAVAGAGAVFYDKGVKQWEVEKPIAGRATNNVAEYVGFVSVLARLLRDPVPPTPRTMRRRNEVEIWPRDVDGIYRLAAADEVGPPRARRAGDQLHRISSGVRAGDSLT